jgi:hypothetical protein
MDGDDLVRDYVGRLEAASWPLSPGRRAELAGEVREHIETALAEAGRRDTVTIRNVLERLGRPEEIVASEAETDAAAPGWAAARGPVPSPAVRTWGAVEIAAVLFLTVGVLLPIVGPLLGLLLVWLSSRWVIRDKLIATAIMAVVLVLAMIRLLSFAA